MGWIQNLWNKIRGNKQPQLNAGYKTIENKMNQYALNVNPTPNGKGQDEKHLEEVLNAFDNGASIEMMIRKYHMLTPTQIRACYHLSASESSREDIEEVGGIKVVVTRMVEIAESTAVIYGYKEDEIGSAMPGGEETLMQIMYEKLQEEYKQRFTIKHPMRNKALNLLYNSALELSLAGGEDVEDILVDYASRIGGIPISVGGEKPMIDEVDLIAIISLANDVKNKKVTANELEEVGGAAKVIDEISIQAKKNAFENNIPISGVIDLLSEAKEIIDALPKESDKGIEY